MKKLLLTLKVVALSASVTLCQDNQQEKNGNQGYITYNKIEDSQKIYDRGVNNLVKINPLLIINGDMPVYFERKIKNKVSLEVGAGVTLKDYVFDLFYVDPDFDYNYEEITERNQLLGYSGSASLRFYPSENTGALEGFFFAPEVRYRNYRSEALRCEAAPNSLFSDDFIDEHRRIIDFKLTFGYITYLNDKILLEWYSGIGVRKRDIAHAYCDNNASQEETVLLLEQDMRPIFSTGLKFGFAF